MSSRPAEAPRPWSRALVTGASAGIGHAIATQLATSGVHLVLVARDESRLQAIAGRLSKDFGVEVEVLAADLSSPDSRRRVEARLRADPFIDMLVNNAGVGTFTSFADADMAAELLQVDVNVVAPLLLTRAALDRMGPESRGTILTISSLDALLPAPYHATYAATKAFVNTFFEGLHEELRHSPIKVTTVMPGYVRTEFTERAGAAGALDNVPKVLVHAPRRVARSALAAAAAGKAMSAPGPIYTTYAAAVDSLPRGVRRRLSNRIVPNRSQDGR